MSICLFYYVRKNSKFLEKSLRTIFEQTSKNFELYIFNDGNDSDVSKVLEEFDFSSIKKFHYYKSTRQLGRGYFYSMAKYLKNSYVWFGSSNCYFAPNFIEINESAIKLTSADVVSFASSGKEERYGEQFNPVELFKSNEFKQLQRFILPYIDDKIYSTKFLNESKISFDKNKYYPLTFMYKAMSKYDKWYAINKQITSYQKDVEHNDNAYEIFDMINELTINYSSSNFWKENKAFIEYLLIIYITCIFLSRIFILHKNYIPRENALRFSEEFMESNFRSWRENKYLEKNSDLLGNKLTKLLQKFKFKSSWVIELMEIIYSKDSIIGDGNKTKK